MNDPLLHKSRRDVWITNVPKKHTQWEQPVYYPYVPTGYLAEYVERPPLQ